MKITNLSLIKTPINTNHQNSQKNLNAFSGGILVTSKEEGLPLIEHPAIVSIMKRTANMLPEIIGFTKNRIILRYPQDLNKAVKEFTDDWNKRAQQGIGYLDLRFEFIEDEALDLMSTNKTKHWDYN